jgi:hypothetical protein
MDMGGLTTHSTGRAISQPFIENLPDAMVHARRLIWALGGLLSKES